MKVDGGRIERANELRNKPHLDLLVIHALAYYDV